MFAVVWLDPILEQLADLYVAAAPADRDRFAAGIDAFNRRLADNPLDVGESRPNGVRIAFPPLVVVVFHVDRTERVVVVTAVNRYGR